MAQLLPIHTMSHSTLSDVPSPHSGLKPPVISLDVVALVLAAVRCLFNLCSNAVLPCCQLRDISFPTLRSVALVNHEYHRLALCHIWHEVKLKAPDHDVDKASVLLENLSKSDMLCRFVKRIDIVEVPWDETKASDFVGRFQHFLLEKAGVLDLTNLR